MKRYTIVTDICSCQQFTLFFNLKLRHLYLIDQLQLHLCLCRCLNRIDPLIHTIACRSALLLHIIDVLCQLQIL